MNIANQPWRRAAAVGVALVLLTVGRSEGTPAALADGSGTYPDSPFNGMQLRYVISGASVTSQEDSSGFTTSRTLKGTLDSNTVHVSGRASMGSGYGARATVTLESGAQRKQWSEYLTTPRSGAASQSFDLTVNVPPDATTATVTINMTGDYNVGTRGLIVTGTFVREPRTASVPATAPLPAPATAVAPATSESRPHLQLLLQTTQVAKRGELMTLRIIIGNAGTAAARDLYAQVTIPGVGAYLPSDHVQVPPTVDSISETAPLSCRWGRTTGRSEPALTITCSAESFPANHTALAMVDLRIPSVHESQVAHFDATGRVEAANAPDEESAHHLLFLYTAE